MKDFILKKMFKDFKQEKNGNFFRITCIKQN